MTFERVSPPEWVERLRKGPQDPVANPAIKLLSFFESKYASKPVAAVATDAAPAPRRSLSCTKTLAVSQSLRDAPVVGKDLMAKYVDVGRDSLVAVPVEASADASRFVSRRRGASRASSLRRSRLELELLCRRCEGPTASLPRPFLSTQLSAVRRSVQSISCSASVSHRACARVSRTPARISSPSMACTSTRPVLAGSTRH